MRASSATAGSTSGGARAPRCTVTRSARPVGEREHAGIADDAGERRAAARPATDLVEPVLEADAGLPAGTHALEAETLADADVDHRAVDAGRSRRAAGPSSGRAGVCTTGLVVPYFFASWPGGLLGRAGREPDGPRRRGSSRHELAVGVSASRLSPAPEVHDELAEQTERHHLHGHDDEQHAELQRRAGCRSRARGASTMPIQTEQHATRRSPITKPMPPKRWNGRAV